MEGNNTDEVLLEAEEYYDPLLDDITLDEILGEENTTASLDSTSNLSVATAPPTEEIGGALLVTALPSTMPGKGSGERRQQGGHSDQEESNHPTTIASKHRRTASN